MDAINLAEHAIVLHWQYTCLPWNADTPGRPLPAGIIRANLER